MKTTKIVPLLGLLLSLLQTTSYANGPGASGGGNMLGGRIVESYQKDLEDIAGYKEVLQPIFKNLEVRLPVLAQALEDSADSIYWYVVPTGLKQQTERITGLPFPSDQVAVQKVGEVWIDQELFNQASMTEKGKLLLHETILKYILGLNSSDDEETRMKMTRQLTLSIAKKNTANEKDLHDELAKIINCVFYYNGNIESKNAQVNYVSICATNTDLDDLLQKAKDAAEKQKQQDEINKQKAVIEHFNILPIFATFSQLFVSGYDQFCTSMKDKYPISRYEWENEFSSEQHRYVNKQLAKLNENNKKFFFSKDGARLGFLTDDEITKLGFTTREIQDSRYPNKLSYIMNNFISDIVNGRDNIYTNGGYDSYSNSNWASFNFNNPYNQPQIKYGWPMDPDYNKITELKNSCEENLQLAKTLLDRYINHPEQKDWWREPTSR